MVRSMLCHPWSRNVSEVRKKKFGHKGIIRSWQQMPKYLYRTSSQLGLRSQLPYRVRYIRRFHIFWHLCGWISKRPSLQRWGCKLTNISPRLKAYQYSTCIRSINENARSLISITFASCLAINSSRYQMWHPKGKKYLNWTKHWRGV